MSSPQTEKKFRDWCCGWLAESLDGCFLILFDKTRWPDGWKYMMMQWLSITPWEANFWLLRSEITPFLFLLTTSQTRDLHRMVDKILRLGWWLSSFVGFSHGDAYKAMLVCVFWQETLGNKQSYLSFSLCLYNTSGQRETFYRAV